MQSLAMISRDLYRIMARPLRYYLRQGVEYACYLWGHQDRRARWCVACGTNSYLVSTPDASFSHIPHVLGRAEVHLDSALQLRRELPLLSGLSTPLPDSYQGAKP